MVNKTEIWKDAFGYEGIYSVSNFGVVNRNLKTKPLKTKSQRLDKRGYSVTTLHKEGISKTMKIHRIVAMAFIPNPENKPQVNHIDGNKLNNRVERLGWVTQSENQIHAYKTGLQKTKLTEKQVLEIRASNLSQRELAKIYNVGNPMICDIINRKWWKHI